MFDITKSLAAGVVVLLAAGGVIATGGLDGPPFDASASDTVAGPHNVEASASLESGNVTVQVVDQHQHGVANVSVVVDGNTMGTTDEDGRMAFNLTTATDGDDLTITLEGTDFTASLDYHVTEDGTLVLLEESYEYSRHLEDDD
ncbi:hypothetical protein [Halorussus sp. AFM4]|uniref:hypothetical protein n=1 Tax=Halorussus sp. AFM4 TaxID=3421651 RepID=UPI003EBFC7D7